MFHFYYKNYNEFTFNYFIFLILYKIVLTKNIRSIPTFHLYKNGTIIDELSGCNLFLLEEKIANLIKDNNDSEDNEGRVEEEQELAEEDNEDSGEKATTDLA